MQVRMRALKERAEAAPLLPKTGVASWEAKNLPEGEYALVHQRKPMAKVVYNMPPIPTSEKGARLAKFFMRHKGSNTTPERNIDGEE